MRFFIYAFRDPLTLEIRYIGKTNNLRLRYNDHICCSRKRRQEHLYRWMAQLDKLGLRPIMHVISCVGSESRCFVRERELIGQLRPSGRLTNIADGGKGATGVRHTPESKAKIAAFFLGKPRTAETRAKISRSHLGKKVSEETRKKISESQVGRKLSEERKRQISQIMRAKIASGWQPKIASLPRGPVSEQTKRKISLANTGRRRTPEQKERISAGMRGLKRQAMTTAQKQRLSAAIKIHWIKRKQRDHA